MAARNFAGGATASTLNGGIASGDTTIVVTSGSTWPTGSASYVIDRGLAGEEKILATRSGNTLTATRGYDGTTAAAHTTGAAIEHVGTATDFQEANDHIQATTGHGATGAVVGTTNTQTLTNKTLTAPAIGGATTFTGTQAGAVLDAASTIGGVSGTSLAADRTAWTAYTPALTGITLGNGSVSGRYKIIGKTMYLQVDFTAGTTTAYTANFLFSLPGGVTSAASKQRLAGDLTVAGVAYMAYATVAASATTAQLLAASTSATPAVNGCDPTHPATWTATSSNTFTLSGAIEVA